MKRTNRDHAGALAASPDPDQPPCQVKQILNLHADEYGPAAVNGVHGPTMRIPMTVPLTSRSLGGGSAGQPMRERSRRRPSPRETASTAAVRLNGVSCRATATRNTRHIPCDETRQSWLLLVLLTAGAGHR